MTTEMWIVGAGCVLICLGGIGVIYRTTRGLKKESPPSLRYNPLCAACGLEEGVYTQWFKSRYDDLTKTLIMTCPYCCFSWSRGFVDEERVTLLLNEHVEEKEEI